MSVLALALAFFAATGQASPGGRGDIAVRDLIVISNDKKIVEKVQTDFKMASPLSEVQKLFAKDRFDLKTWGSRGLVVLDRRLWRLVEVKQATDMARALAVLGRSGLAGRIGDLPPDEKAVICGYMDEATPPGMRPSGFNLEDGAIGLSGSVSITMRDPNTGRSFDVDLPQNIRESGHRDQILARMPIPSRVLSNSEFSKLAAAHAAEERENEDVQFHLFGLARTALPDGMRVAADLIAEVEGKLKAERAQAGRALMKLLGLNENLPGSVPSVNDLPQDLRDQLTSSLTSNWQAYGLGSQQEAESLLANTDSVAITTWVGFNFCTDPGDPKNHRPGGFGSYLIIGCQGGAGP
ncbi:MAG TPA: hypothetical protein VMI31_01585 [Fimbriimonadaceae bacterium]|nr:hypothetical protein [Fimbriimonadaceae bacterium]